MRAVRRAQAAGSTVRFSLASRPASRLQALLHVFPLSLLTCCRRSRAAGTALSGVDAVPGFNLAGLLRRLGDQSGRDESGTLLDR